MRRPLSDLIDTVARNAGTDQDRARPGRRHERVAEPGVPAHHGNGFELLLVGDGNENTSSFTGQTHAGGQKPFCQRTCEGLVDSQNLACGFHFRPQDRFDAAHL